ncbi:DMT family transporter [Phytoactinopolyspora endophytica]|uniref:DMT family transporter n=1 Tax=Phytoactinopolyspora endophytica TaxID=1642495 RepID=UPI00101CB407|nr:EamA family transporter [Phytoactinopolyspora endophytica]
MDGTNTPGVPTPGMPEPGAATPGAATPGASTTSRSTASASTAAAAAVAPARGDQFAVVAAGVLWGTGGLAGTLLGDSTGVGPMAVAGYRLAIGGMLIVGWLLISGRLRTLRPGQRGLQRLLVLAVITAWYQSWYFAAIELNSVGLATLLTLGAAPVIVVVAESVIGRRRPTRRTIVAIGTAAAGLVLLVGAPDAGGLGTAIAGGLCALASAGGFAAITVLGARPVGGLTALPTIGVSFCVGGVITLPLAALIGDLAVDVRAETVMLLVYLGVAPTAVAYVLYFTALRSVATGSAVLISLLEPLTAAVLGAVLLQENLGVRGVVGAVLVALAVVVTSSHRRSECGAGGRRRLRFNR